MSSRARGLRRRRKPSLLGRLRVFWILIVVVLAAAAYGAYTLVRLPALRVHAVGVTDGGTRVARSEILAAARIDRHANVWLLDAGAIAARVEALPYVDVARVIRRPPAELEIAVTERVPSACVRTAARSLTIDRTQRIVQTGCADGGLTQLRLEHPLPGAPGTTVTDPELVALVADSRILAEAHLALRSVARDRFGDLVAVDGAGIELLFGADDGLAEKAALIDPIRHAGETRKIRAIDVRAPATPIVDYRS